MNRQMEFQQVKYQILHFVLIQRCLLLKKKIIQQLYGQFNKSKEWGYQIPIKIQILSFYLFHFLVIVRYCSHIILIKIRCWKITDKFELIKLQDLSNHLHQKYSLDLHLHPIKDEEFILIWAEVVEIQPQCWVDKFYFQIGHDIEELCIPIEDFKNWNEKFTTAFNESNSLIALQIETILKLYDISQGQRRVVATLEGNPLDNLMFSSDGKILLSLGIDLTLRLYDISDQNSLKVKINLKNPIQALAMSLLNQYSIRIFTELGTIIDQNISDYKEIVVIKDENQFDYTASIKQLNMFKYSGKVNNRTLEILDSQTSQLKYTLDKFSSKINAISFAPSQEQFVLGMEDGQILFYKIDQQTTKIYDIPVCYHIFAKNRLLTAQYCKIRKSTFKTIENVNFEKVLCEYGAIK